MGTTVGTGNWRSLRDIQLAYWDWEKVMAEGRAVVGEPLYDSKTQKLTTSVTGRYFIETITETVITTADPIREILRHKKTFAGQSSNKRATKYMVFYHSRWYRVKMCRDGGYYIRPHGKGVRLLITQNS